MKRMDNPGSRRLIVAASAKGADAQRGVPLPAGHVERLRQAAIEQNFVGRIQTGYHGRRWTDEEAALLGKMPDAEVEARTGWKAEAVRRKRESLGVPNAFARLGAYGADPWTDAEDELLRRLPPQEAAKQTGRTLDAVYSRRSMLGLPPTRRGPAPRS